MTTIKKVLENEDWLSFFVAVIIIAVIFLINLTGVPDFSWEEIEDLWQSMPSDSNIVRIGLFYPLLFGAASVYALIHKKSKTAFLLANTVLVPLSISAFIVAGNAGMKSLGLEYVIFSLILGLFISNALGVTDFFKEALFTEYFVKIGLVILGSSVLFQDVLKAGALGLIQAVVVVFSVWYFAYWLCKKLKVDEELTFMISSAVSICGVSAAIATAGAIQGDRKKLSYVISLVLITAIPMMLFMPVLAALFHFSPEITGAWLGGTIDTTGAVVIAGSLAGETALKVSSIVKFSQNVLLGVAAFIISIWWSYRKSHQIVEKPSIISIWKRFPKFVLGFVFTSLFFSLCISAEVNAHYKDSFKFMQNMFFSLSFLCIGLETRFSELFNLKNYKPALAFIIAQLFNIILTLIVALLIFKDFTL